MKPVLRKPCTRNVRYRIWPCLSALCERDRCGAVSGVLAICGKRPEPRAVRASLPCNFAQRQQMVEMTDRLDQRQPVGARVDLALVERCEAIRRGAGTRAQVIAQTVQGAFVVVDHLPQPVGQAGEGQFVAGRTSCASVAKG